MAIGGWLKAACINGVAALANQWPVIENVGGIQWPSALFG